MNNDDDYNDAHDIANFVRIHLLRVKYISYSWIGVDFDIYFKERCLPLHTYLKNNYFDWKCYGRSCMCLQWHVQSIEVLVKVIKNRIWHLFAYKKESLDLCLIDNFKEIFLYSHFQKLNIKTSHRIKILTIITTRILWTKLPSLQRLLSKSLNSRIAHHRSLSRNFFLQPHHHNLTITAPICTTSVSKRLYIVNSIRIRPKGMPPLHFYSKF